MLGSCLQCLFWGAVPWLLPKSSFYLPGRVCCVGVTRWWPSGSATHRDTPPVPSWLLAPFAGPAGAVPQLIPPWGWRGGSALPALLQHRDRTTAQGRAGSITPCPAAFHSCLPRPSVHDLDCANPSYTRGIRFCHGDEQSVFLQLFFPELVPGSSGSSLVTAVHIPPSSACPDFVQPPQLSTLLQHQLAGWSTDYPSCLICLQKKKAHFTHNHHFKEKLPPLPLSNPNTGVPMRGSRKAELPVQSHCFGVTQEPAADVVLDPNQPSAPLVNTLVFLSTLQEQRHPRVACQAAFKPPRRLGLS